MIHWWFISSYSYYWI